MKAKDRLTTAFPRKYGVLPGESLSQQFVCLSCRHSAARRHYASAAAVQTVMEQPPASSTPEPAATSRLSPQPTYRMHTGVVLSRPPQITRDLHPFESAFYFYQKRLNERLALPFMRYFYYRKGTPSDLMWKRKMRERLTPARDIGKYTAYGKEAWHDELLVGDKLSDQQTQMESLLQDADTPSITGGPDQSDAAGLEQAASKETDVEKPLERNTEADRVGDVTSLNRQLQRTLFLLVRNEKDQWTFPTARSRRGESLDQGAERCLEEAAGPNMNTWVVGHHPIGHYASHFESPTLDTEKSLVELGEKHFFMKGRIMAGQANLTDNKLGLKEFRWLTREEIKQLVTPKYWSMTEAMLGDR